MPAESYSSSIRFSRRSAHRAPTRTRIFLSIPEPQLSLNDSQQGFFDKYSDAFFYIPMLLGALASFATGAWKFFRSGSDGKVDNPIALYALAGSIRDARSEADLTAIEEKIDNIIKAELTKHAKGESQAADSAALSLVTQRLEHLIHDRRARLPAVAE